MVAEYKADECASCNEDEKKIEKAERTAERKALRKRKAKSGSGRFLGKPPQTSREAATSPWRRNTPSQWVQAQMKT